MEQENIFLISPGTQGAADIVDKIRRDVAGKMAAGLYTDPCIARAERTNLANIRNEEDFLPFYFDCLRASVFVDINDFEIAERRRSFSKLLVILKKSIWSVLKFYTYRLWSQQNQVNGLLFSAIEDMHGQYRRKIAALENKIRELEKKSDNGQG